MGMGPIVGSSRNADVRFGMATGAGAEGSTVAGAATGSDIEVGVADPLHPTSARIIRVPIKSEATGPESLSSPLDFSCLIL